MRNFASVVEAQAHYDRVYANRTVRVTTAADLGVVGQVVAESIDGGEGEHGEVYSLSVLVRSADRVETLWCYVDEVVLLPQ